MEIYEVNELHVTVETSEKDGILRVYLCKCADFLIVPNYVLLVY